MGNKMKLISILLIREFLCFGIFFLVKGCLGLGYIPDATLSRQKASMSQNTSSKPKSRKEKSIQKKNDRNLSTGGHASGCGKKYIFRVPGVIDAE